jgi:hypothetical protein
MSVYKKYIIIKKYVGVFPAIRIHNEKRKCQPIGNKESKNQPIGDKDKKKFLRMWNVTGIYLERALPLNIQIHDRGGKFEWLWY